MRQLIIARKDLGMSSGKLAAQCCHASVAFLEKIIKDGVSSNGHLAKQIGGISFQSEIRVDIYKDWMCDTFTKTICAAKNKNHLMKAVKMAKEIGLREGEDFFFLFETCVLQNLSQKILMIKVMGIL